MGKPHNYMEDLVDIVLNDILKAQEIKEGLSPCTCEQCLNDVRSLALNELPPRYVATSDDTIKAKIISSESQLRVEITNILTSSIRTVKDNPRH